MNNNPINSIDPLGLQKDKKKKKITAKTIKDQGGTIIDTTKKGKIDVPKNEPNINKIQKKTKVDEVKDPDFYDRISESLEWTEKTGYESGFSVDGEGNSEKVQKAYNDEDPRLKKELKEAEENAIKAFESKRRGSTADKIRSDIRRKEKYIERQKNKGRKEKAQRELKEMKKSLESEKNRMIMNAKKAVLAHPKYSVSSTAMTVIPNSKQRTNYHSHPPNGFLGPNGVEGGQKGDRSTLGHSSSGWQFLSAPNDSGYSQLIAYDAAGATIETNIWIKYEQKK